MFEVPGADPGPQPNSEFIASDYLTGMRDQRAEDLSSLSGEPDFVTILPQFSQSRIELERPKGYLRGSRGRRVHRIVW
jgi:hypothetical protein